MKNIVILGSTGSIGTQTLDVISKHSDKFKVIGLSAGGNLSLIIEQILQFKPLFVSVSAESDSALLRKKFPALTVYSGAEGLNSLAGLPQANLVVVSLVGSMAIAPTLIALESGKDVALATKEVLVAAGSFINAAAKASGARLFPIDSEHSAVAQCLSGSRPEDVRRIILTASGGPFLNTPIEQLKSVTPADALKHPNWDMGNKISIDSATMINKGLEVIEAYWLFAVPLEKIEVVIHPQSTVHSMVEFVDGSIIAQLGVPDMRLPIQYALSCSARWSADFPRFDFTKAQKLDFRPVDHDKYPGLNLAFSALKLGGVMPAVYNAANEVAVDLFLKGAIGFLDIPKLVKAVMSDIPSFGLDLTLESVLKADQWARACCLQRQLILV